MSASLPPQDGRARRTPVSASLGYSLFYGLGFGLSAWGYDGWALSRSHAELPWAKLGVGLPLVLLICALTGALAGRSNRAGVWTGAWMAGGALMGVVAGVVPFNGRTLVAWLAEPAMAGMNVYPVHPAALGRTAFTVFVAGSMGAPAGLVGHLAVERAQGTTDGGNTRWRQGVARRWAGLLLGLPLAALSGLVGDELINRPARVGQWAVYRAISTAPGEVLDHLGQGAVAPYRDRLSAGYVLYLVDWSTGDVSGGKEGVEVGGRSEGVGSVDASMRPGWPRSRGDEEVRSTVDVAFDAGLGMRCRTSGSRLDSCFPISPRFEAWMAALIEAGRSGGQGTELDPQPGQVWVGEDTLRWLALQRETLGGPYEVFKDTQRGAWVIMSARFDTGHVLTCTFYGDSPVVLDRCSGSEHSEP
jgi:hypothetical protein